MFSARFIVVVSFHTGTQEACSAHDDLDLCHQNCGSFTGFKECLKEKPVDWKQNTEMLSKRNKQQSLTDNCKMFIYVSVKSSKITMKMFLNPNGIFYCIFDPVPNENVIELLRKIATHTINTSMYTVWVKETSGEGAIYLPKVAIFWHDLCRNFRELGPDVHTCSMQRVVLCSDALTARNPQEDSGKVLILLRRSHWQWRQLFICVSCVHGSVFSSWYICFLLLFPFCIPCLLEMLSLF